MYGIKIEHIEQVWETTDSNHHSHSDNRSHQGRARPPYRGQDTAGNRVTMAGNTIRMRWLLHPDRQGSQDHHQQDQRSKCRLCIRHQDHRLRKTGHRYLPATRNLSRTWVHRLAIRRGWNTSILMRRSPRSHYRCCGRPVCNNCVRNVCASSSGVWCLI